MRELPLYPLDQSELEIPIRESGQTYVYKLRRPTMQDEHETERLSQTVKVTHPKNKAGESRIEIKTDHTRAYIAYAKRLIKSVSGFHIEPDISSQGEFVDVSLPAIPPSEHIAGQTVLDMLPVHHIRAVGEKVFGGEIKVIEPSEGKIVRSLTGQNLTGLEWLIKDTVIDEETEDDVNDPYAGIGHRVVFLFKDPTARALRLWSMNAFNKMNHVGKDNKVTETSSYNLPAIYELAKTCVHSIRGASIGGREVDLEKHPEDWEWIPHRIQKGMVAIFFDHIVNELGN